MKAGKIIAGIVIVFLFLWLILPWIILGIFALLAFLGIIELEPVSDIFEVLWSVVRT